MGMNVIAFMLLTEEHELRPFDCGNKERYGWDDGLDRQQ